MHEWALLFMIIGFIGIGLWIHDIVKNRHTATQSSDASSDKIDWHVMHYPVDEILQKDAGPKRRLCSAPVTVPGGLRFTYKGDRADLLQLAVAQKYDELAPLIGERDDSQEPGDGLDFLDETPYGLLNKKPFIRFLRNAASTPPDQPLILYRRYYGTETRYYDQWSKDYVYHYSYVVLMPDNTYTELKADREYSPTMDRD
jgi:hypothetical protein